MTMLTMNVRSWLSAGTLALALLAPGLLASPARAQSESDLRRQNQELATKVTDLEAELDAARKQVEALRAQIASLQQQLVAARSGGGSAATPLEEPKTTIDESKANASPRALFAAVAESYKKAVADVPMGQSGDRERIAYMRVLDKWAAATQREYRAPIDWVVRVVPDSSTASPSKGTFTFVAVDPVTDARLGDDFNITLSRTLAARLAEIESRGELGQLHMKGTVIPGVRINPEREVRGSFDNPRFVGPFAEFGFTVEPASITPYKAPPPPATAPATPAAPATPEK